MAKQLGNVRISRSPDLYHKTRRAKARISRSPALYQESRRARKG